MDPLFMKCFYRQCNASTTRYMEVAKLCEKCVIWICDEHAHIGSKCPKCNDRMSYTKHSNHPRMSGENVKPWMHKDNHQRMSEENEVPWMRKGNPPQMSEENEISWMHKGNPPRMSEENEVPLMHKGDLSRIDEENEIPWMHEGDRSRIDKDLWMRKNNVTFTRLNNRPYRSINDRRSIPEDDMRLSRIHDPSSVHENNLNDVSKKSCCGPEFVKSLSRSIKYCTNCGKFIT